MTTIIVSSKKLLKALRQTKPCLGSPAFPLYDHYMIEATTDDTISVMATDGSTTAIRNIDVTIEGDRNVQFAVHGYFLSRMLRLLPDQPLSVSCYDTQIAVHHQDGTFYLPTMDSAGRNVMVFNEEECHYAKFEVPQLKKYLKRSAMAVADDELRPVMNGIFFEFTKDGACFITASDGHILSSSEIYTGFEGPGCDASFVMPKKIIQMLLHVLPKAGWCKLWWNDSQIAVSITDNDGSEDLHINGKLIEGRYPNWRSVIPKSFQMSICVERKRFTLAVRRAAVFAPASHLLLFTVSQDSLRINSKDGDYEHGSEEHIPVSASPALRPVSAPSVAPSASAYRIAFSHYLLLRLLKVLTEDQITINCNNLNGASTISQDSSDTDTTTYLIMSMYTGE